MRKQHWGRGDRGKQRRLNPVPPDTCGASSDAAGDGAAGETPGGATSGSTLALGKVRIGGSSELVERLAAAVIGALGEPIDDSGESPRRDGDGVYRYLTYIVPKNPEGE